MRLSPRASLASTACPFPNRRWFVMVGRRLRRRQSSASRWSSRLWVWLTRPDVGGVRLDLEDGEAVSAAVEEMSGLAESFLVEKMVEGVVAELIVGVARDEQFGPYLIVGAGGILVELMKDSRSILLPVDKARVLDALGQAEVRPSLRWLQGATAR